MKKRTVPQFISKTELSKQKPDNKKSYNVGEIYPAIFYHGKDLIFSENMPLEVAVIWLGAYQLENGLFPKYYCPICKKEEALIPYMCGGSILSGCHTILFYCTNCKEQFATNDDIEYFRLIYKYILNNREKLSPSSHFEACSKVV